MAPITEGHINIEQRTVQALFILVVFANEDNHDPATVTVQEVQAPRGYLMDPRPQTAVVAPTYTRVTHVETWTVTIVTETTSPA